MNEKLQNILGKKPKKGNSKLLYEVAIILFGIIGGYFYYTQFLENNLEPVIVTDIDIDDNLSKFKDTQSLDLQIFSETSYRTLKIIGEIPVKPGQTGRTDMFAPY